jgi:hypothetical protein
MSMSHGVISAAHARVGSAGKTLPVFGNKFPFSFRGRRLSL